MAVHAFMDESERDRRYYLCIAIVEPVQLKPLRRKLNCLLMPGQRELHFKQEKQPRRRAVADKVAQLSVAVRVYQTAYTPKNEESARQACLDLVMSDLLNAGAHRLVIDTRAERDRFDANTIRNQLHDQPVGCNFSYDHCDSKQEPLCWIADVAGWCFGAGGDWRKRIMPIIDDVIEV